MKNGCTIRMQIWDPTSGLRIHAAIRYQFQNAEIGIYVYGIDNKKSFDTIKELHNKLKENYNNKIILPYWTDIR